MKFAVHFDRGAPACDRTIARMGDALVVREDQERRRFSCGDGWIEAVTNTVTDIEQQLIQRSSNGNLLVISGAPIANGAGLQETLSRIVELDHHEASTSLSNLDGAFAALFWDETARKLVIVSDILGMQPLYISRPAPGCLLLASDVRSIAASRQFGIEMNPVGWGSLWLYGTTFEDDTLMTGVERVPPGRASIYDPARDSLEGQNYWRWPEVRPELTLDALDTEALLKTLERECNAYLDYGVPSTVLLSGGADSRLIAAILHRMGADPSALCVAHEGEHLGADGRWGVQVAEAYGIPHRHVHGDRDFYSSQGYLDFLVMNEVFTASLRHFIASISTTITPGLGAIWDGAFLGTSLKTFYMGTTAEYIWLKGKDPWAAIQGVFSAELNERFRDGIDERVPRLLAGYPDDGHGVMELINRNLKRNRTAPNPLKIYSNHVLSFTPGLSREWQEMTGGIPREHKFGLALYDLIFERHFPELTKVPIVSGGKLISAEEEREPRAGWIGSAANALGRRLPGKLGSALSPPKKSFFNRSELIAPVILSIDPEHPDLNQEVVLQVQKRLRSKPMEHSQKTELLFYWQIWRWIMGGERDRLDSTQLRGISPLH